MKTWIVGMVLVVLCSTCVAGWETTPGTTWDTTTESADANEITINPHWSIEAGGVLGSNGDSLYTFSAMYWRSYSNDGGIGVIAFGDDTADGEQSLIAGPGAEFATGPIYDAVLEEVLPDNLADVFKNLTAMARPYARGGLLFDEDGAVSPLVGTGIRLFPNSSLQPTLRTDWINPQGRAKEFLEDGFKTTLSVTWFF